MAQKQEQKLRTATLNTAQIRRIAVLACVDPRSVTKWLRGEPLQGLVSMRIAEVCAREGVTPEAAKI